MEICKLVWIFGLLQCITHCRFVEYIAVSFFLGSSRYFISTPRGRINAAPRAAHTFTVGRGPFTNLVTLGPPDCLTPVELAAGLFLLAPHPPVLASDAASSAPCADMTACRCAASACCYFRSQHGPTFNDTVPLYCPPCCFKISCYNDRA